jgi:hypothetical protein
MTAETADNAPSQARTCRAWAAEWPVLAAAVVSFVGINGSCSFGQERPDIRADTIRTTVV